MQPSHFSVTHTTLKFDVKSVIKNYNIHDKIQSKLHNPSGMPNLSGDVFQYTCMCCRKQSHTQNMNYLTFMKTFFY